MRISHPERTYKFTISSPIMPNFNEIVGQNKQTSCPQLVRYQSSKILQIMESVHTPATLR